MKNLSRLIAVLLVIARVATGYGATEGDAERETPRSHAPDSPANVPQAPSRPSLESPTAKGGFSPWIISAHFSYLDLILPGKYGVAVERRDTEKSTIELEYTHGSLTPFFISDLGRFSEDRISLLHRFGRQGIAGFQWFYGAFYHSFKIEIGNALLSRLTTYYPAADVLSISGVGAVIGVGYRWFVSDNFVLGLDAITYSQPIFTLSREAKFLDVVTDPGDRDKVESGLNVVRFFPRLAVAKVAIGYVF